MNQPQVAFCEYLTLLTLIPGLGFILPANCQNIADLDQ